MSKLQITPVLRIAAFPQTQPADVTTGFDTFQTTTGAFVYAENDAAASDSATITIKPIQSTIESPIGGLQLLDDIVVDLDAGDTKLFAVPSAYIGLNGQVKMEYTDADDLIVGVGYAR